MQLKVNGIDRQVGGDIADSEPTVRVLLQDLGLDRDGIAVAVNGVVVPRNRHGETMLREGDDVEVIRAVGGG